MQQFVLYFWEVKHVPNPWMLKTSLNLRRGHLSVECTSYWGWHLLLIHGGWQNGCLWCSVAMWSDLSYWSFGRRGGKGDSERDEHCLGLIWGSASSSSKGLSVSSTEQAASACLGSSGESESSSFSNVKYLSHVSGPAPFLLGPNFLWISPELLTWFPLCAQWLQ